MVWSKKKRAWKLRQRGFAIGRIYSVHPIAGDKFYQHLLLTIVHGPKSAIDLQTFDGTVYPTFKAACLAQGLLENDEEWSQCLQEAATMQLATSCMFFLQPFFMTAIHLIQEDYGKHFGNTYVMI